MEWLKSGFCKLGVQAAAFCVVEDDQDKGRIHAKGHSGSLAMALSFVGSRVPSSGLRISPWEDCLFT